ncbi:COP9 signalosome complex subunit 3 [Actinomortierella wolfii]|nr:COP9 signalosome complex subunit 3 [Actinomortierella wolfii]
MASKDISLEEVISIIQSSDSITSITKTLAPLLHDLDDQVFQARPHDQPDPMDMISPDIHSLAYLYFLTARCKHTTGFNPALFRSVWNFVNVFDPAQIRIVMNKGMSLSFAEALVNAAEESRQLFIAIRPLATFVQRLQTSPGQLTMLHPLLAKISLSAQSFHDIKPILDNDISDVAPQATLIDYRDVLLYHYYGGMIYTYLKQFDRAVHFYKIVVSAPAEVASAIQVEAYKKFVLTSLLQYGKVKNLPRYISAPVLRAIKSLCAPYNDFAGAYEKSITVLRAEAERNRSFFVRDRNYGLVKQCMEALYKRNIQDLTRTYLTLSLKDIAEQIGLGSDDKAIHQVEGIMIRMIESGAVFATISHEHRGGMVSFLDDPNQHNTTVTMDMLNEQIQRATEITAKLVKMDQTISTLPAYLKGGHGGHHADRSSFYGEDDYGMQVGFDYADDESFV